MSLSVNSVGATRFGADPEQFGIVGGCQAGEMQPSATAPPCCLLPGVLSSRCAQGPPVPPSISAPRGPGSAPSLALGKLCASTRLRVLRLRPAALAHRTAGATLGVLGATLSVRVPPWGAGATLRNAVAPISRGPLQGCRSLGAPSCPSPEADPTGDDGIVDVTVARQDPEDRDRPRCPQAPPRPSPQPSFPSGLGCSPPRHQPHPAAPGGKVLGCGAPLSSRLSPSPLLSLSLDPMRGRAPLPRPPQRQLLTSNYLLHHVPLDRPGPVRAETSSSPGFPLLDLCRSRTPRASPGRYWGGGPQDGLGPAERG